MRTSLQETRFDDEAAERKRLADEREADIERVKAQSEAAIHAAEDAARKRLNPNGAVPPKPEAWYQEGVDRRERPGRCSSVWIAWDSKPGW